MRPLLALILSATPTLAETPLSGPEFDAATQGATITYDYGGGLFGTEEYLADRRVREHGSGLDQPGRHVAFGLDWRF